MFIYFRIFLIISLIEFIKSLSFYKINTIYFRDFYKKRSIFLQNILRIWVKFNNNLRVRGLCESDSDELNHQTWVWKRIEKKKRSVTVIEWVDKNMCKN